MLELNKIINTVIQNDCLNVLKQLPDKCMDLVLTDPPYAGAGMEYEDYNDKNIDDTTDLILNFLKEAKRVAKITIFPSGKFLTEIKLYQLCPPPVATLLA